MNKDAACIFCKIIAGEIPATKVYEDVQCLAFLDIKPINVGHTLVVPKPHMSNLYDMPEDVIGPLFSVVKKIAIAVGKVVSAHGINIGMNNEAAAGQIVMHAHVHVIPRFPADGLRHWKGIGGYAGSEMYEIAEKIKNALT